MGAESSSDGVSLQISGPIAKIVVNRPGKRNALQLATWQAIPPLVAAAEQDAAVSVILIRGAAGHFSSGNDIAEFSALRGDPAAAEAFGRAMAAAMRSVEDACKPVLMAIEGVCYGAAVALALAGDLRVAADSAVFAITPAKLGALYLRSDLHRLAAAVGVGQSKKLIYSAEAVSAAQARLIGLVDEIIPEAQFEADLERLVEAILGGSPFTLRRTKEMLREVGHGATPRETSGSLAPFVEATQGDEFAEGVRAFLAKETPQFRRPSAS